ncbi:flocculation FLO11-like [Brachionus plicatilis]|uniref:Flocculation FLO11-like n=1 Tax=Brachionus plicatilis TaxID=10195 RepID=A0A3M7QPE2_BRAPC|nr:flocculation FLO11-like [Brachionus plicatilis]
MEVETLLVVDPTVYEDHKAFLQTTDDTAIFDHIRTYYAHTFNGSYVDDKYQRSLESDPDLRLRIRLIHVLIITKIYIENRVESTWTDVNIVGETGNEVFNGKEVILSRLTLNELQSFVDRQGLTFEFDHVIGVFNKDLWSDDRTALPSARSPVIGVAWLDSICSDVYKYSISEEIGGFWNLYVIAHEIGHNLGSRHDGSGYVCPASEQNIMAPFFENSVQGSCLINSATVPDYVKNANYELTGQIWSLDG